MIKKKRKKKKFCPKGHNTFTTGRYKDGRCAQCKRDSKNKKYKHVKVDKRRIKKQFCLRGHNTFKYGRDKSGGCLICSKQYHLKYDKKRYRKNRKRHLAYARKYRKEHRKEINKKARIYYKRKRKIILERSKKTRKRYYTKNKKKISIYNKKWRIKNKKKLKIKRLIYKRKNPEIFRLDCLKRKKIRGKRVVKFSQKGIRKFYKKCSKNRVVDHYIPLCGRKVSGLHVIWNLQYLTPKQNNKKRNNVNLKEVSKWYDKLLKKAGLK